MRYEAGRCKTFSNEWWSTRAKVAPSPHRVRLSRLDSNPVFQCLENVKKMCFVRATCMEKVSRYTKIMSKDTFNPIQDGLFRGCSRMEGAPSLKSVKHILQWWNLAQLCFTQRRSKKYMNHVTHPLNFAGISIFSRDISKFCYIKKYRYRLHFDT